MPDITDEKLASIVPLLSRALQRLRSTPPRIITSPPTQPRRAAVALIIRVVPSPNGPTPSSSPGPTPTLAEFFKLDWVNAPGAQPEILFLQREEASSTGLATEMQKTKNTKEAHVAFPGGRTEEGDEGGLYTAMRQTWEELGLDLAERDFICIGQLDDREITTSMGKRLLMILSPFVFLQLTPTEPPMDLLPSISLHWTPLSTLVFPQHRWSQVSVDVASRIALRHSTALRVLVRILVGTMQFPALILDQIPASRSKYGRSQNSQLKLWGLSLGMTLDLVSHMAPPASNSARSRKNSASSCTSLTSANGMQIPFQAMHEQLRMEVVAPSLASMFPRFSYPDVNFWIWVFGKRYREVVRAWEASVLSGGTNDKRINWSGSALNTFYAAIRKALLVVMVARALGLATGLGGVAWWLLKT